MGKIEKILKKGPVEGQTTEVYPVTSTKAVYDENNKRLDNIITGLQESIYLNIPIPISTENTPESMAQNVKNIADYVEKAKAAGLANVDGMAVTCIIDGDYSAVGYLYREEDFVGVVLYDNNLLSYVSIINGSCNILDIITRGASNQVTSSMLDKGARNPIILTSSTTEVDEETYQKLLSDDVDVWLKIDQSVGKFCPLIYKFDSGSALKLYFTYFSMEGETIYDAYLSAYEMGITKTSPHTCSIFENFNDTLDVFINNAGYLNEAYLNAILPEIDLTGTDADRKAKLDKFEIDWKDLTGASDLRGARFVGGVDNTDNSGTCSVLFTFDYSSNSLYQGCAMASDTDKKIVRYTLYKNDGSLVLTPLFSHLEAVTLRVGFSPDVLTANVAAIKAYVDNLTALGVDTTKGYTIPIKISDGTIGEIYPNNNEYEGFVIKDRKPYKIVVTQNGIWATYLLLDNVDEYHSLYTINKNIIPAINEVNDLAKGYSTIFTPIELTTETAQNKTAIDARVAAFTAQGISLTNGCCIPVTYKGVYAGNISLINGDWYGLLVKNTNNPADNINIKLSADGTITEGNSVQ